MSIVVLALLTPREQAVSLAGILAQHPPAAQSVALPRTIRFDHPTADHGLSDNLMLSVLQDRSGFLWFGSRNGLNRFDGYEVTVYRHDSADAASLSDNSTHVLFEDRAGVLWVGTSGGGLNRFDPATGTFTAFRHDPSNPHSLSFDDLLKIYEDRSGMLWIGTRRLTTYTNLDPGQHVFRVTASNGDGVWNATGRALAITIVPPWWQRRWFRTLLIGSLAGLAVLGSWWRMSRLRAQQRRLEQQVAERTQELEQANARLATEIVQHEQTEAQMRRARDELATLLGISQSIVSMLDLEPLLDRVLEQLAPIVDYDGAFVGTLDGELLQIRTYRSRVPRRAQYPKQLDASRIPPLRELITTRQPFLIGDSQHDRQSEQCSATPDQGYEPNRSWMGVPLVVQDRVIGVLSLLHQRADAYGPADLTCVQAFANLVALALENAQLYQRAREAATLEERTRLARELHDAVTQSLFSASLVAEALPKAWHEAPPLALHGIEHVRQLTRGALAEMRTLLVELRPAALTEKPLDELLKALCTATASRSQVPVVLDARGNCVLLPEVQIGLYRIAQEALNNVVKHAEASQVRVKAVCHPSEVVLVITDDGRGFEAGTVAPDGFGQAIMRERADEIGARLHVTSRPGKGTTVAVEWRPRGDGTSDPRGETTA